MQGNCTHVHNTFNIILVAKICCSSTEITSAFYSNSTSINFCSFAMILEGFLLHELFSKAAKFQFLLGKYHLRVVSHRSDHKISTMEVILFLSVPNSEQFSLLHTKADNH